MNWTVYTLSEVADFNLGKMLDQNKNRGELRPYLANINVRWGEFVLDNLREMRFEDRELERYGLQSGDIVMCEGGEPGRCAIWKDQLPGMMFQKALHRIRPHSCLDNRFLYYSFLQKGRVNGFSGLFTGSTIKHLPKEKLAKIEVSLPPLPEQQRIASILSAYDDLIENNRRRIALLEEAARQLYKEWFVRFRFPGHEHVKIIDGVPEGWKSTKLGDIITTNDRSYSAKNLPDYLRYIDISSVNRGEITLNSPIASDEAPGRARRIANHGDVIWSNVRPNLRAYALVMNPGEVDVFSTGFTVLSSDILPFSFLYLHTTADAFVSYLINHTTGASYPAVRPADFEKADVVVPPDHLLSAFHDMCEPSFEMAAILRQQNGQLAKARDLLLPRLMSGAITV